jgi:hypothetical protein
MLLVIVLAAVPAGAQEGVFLSEAEAPHAVFPDADSVARREVEVTSALRDAVGARLGATHASVWEPRWVVFRAQHGTELLGNAIVVEEIGKHRPITFVVGLRPDGRVADVAVMAYREAHGGEIRSARFLSQYHDKGPADDLRPYRDIRNVAGATLSVEAASRAVKKAQAVAAALGLAP